MYINALINLFSDVLTEHMSNQLEIRDVNGFALLGFLFEKLSKYLDTNSVLSIDKLIRSVSGKLLNIPCKYKFRQSAFRRLFIFIHQL